ncbi:aarF domain-containing protein kinase 1 precursor [Xenopus laevis]|uniref:AarF domain-containing protein kinase 1 n=1 Tax=Xenopus laevis TaxID=8355 RepID=ADCK1_XENLA|nr:aarF domain-containing protein kinase 1 [Xenopus laevis]Q6INL7.1 RecName: Full=AarF domain-containing protein kinase 1; Flags: Precursor [Xenopus laevis]AAH72263.1 MGC82384 protein [Xenopus laevis]
MVRGIIRIASLASVSLSSSGFFLYGTGYWDPSDFGVVRIGRAVLTTAAITWDYFTKLRHVEAGTEEYENIKSQVHLRSAHRLLDLCCFNRGTFIKVGQHLAALEYLVPPEYTKTLSVLHSQAPCTPFTDVVQVIREDLGKEISEVFEEFEKTPLGAASLAQVHRAVLQDGRKVAVKVQHPKVQAQSSRDILIMEVLLHVVKKIFPQFEFMWLIEEAKKNLPLELDFQNEGRNAEKMSSIVSSFSFLRIPRIYWELSTKRVLVMEYMEGGQVNDREYMKRNQIDVNKVSHALGKLYSEMIFVHGFVHCDPHPGNVLVRQNPENCAPEIILLDHGLYQVLTESFRLDYCSLWQALIAADKERIRIYSQRLGAGELYPLFACMLTARSWESVNRGIYENTVSKEEIHEIRSNAATYLPEISQLLASVPRQMLLLLKTNDLLRGIETSLGTHSSSSAFFYMSRCCVRALARHRKEKADSLWSYIHISLSETFCLGQLQMYEIALRLQSCIGRWINHVLLWLYLQ